MNKIILAHLNHLVEKANSNNTAKWAKYKPISPFKTNKIQRIDEQINDFNRPQIENLLKNYINEELY